MPKNSEICLTKSKIEQMFFPWFFWKYNENSNEIYLGILVYASKKNKLITLWKADKTYVLPTGWNHYVTNCGINKQTKTEPGKQEVKIELPM